MFIHFISAFCFWIFYISLVTVDCNDTEEQTKRLLLNDPDVINARMTALENKVTQSHTALENKVTQSQTAFEKSQALLENKISQLQTELSEEKTKNANMRQTVINIDRTGSTYVRWGRTTCPGSNSDQVYSGYAAGSSYYHTATKSNYGGPSNTLCLPADPEISNETYSATDTLLYGSEYERNYFASNSADEDMPCVVCKMRTAGTTLMIPGRKSCYNGWNIEYTGLLASGYLGHSPSNYLCVDSHPEYIPSGQENKNGHLFYVVGYKCGSLPCPPYHDNRIAYCVVCSK